MDILDIEPGLKTEDMRSVLYYVSRYIKQAESFERYGKDFLEDEFQSLPSNFVRRVSLALIKFIEDREGLPASQFNDEATVRILAEIAEAEASLVAPASDAEVRIAEEFYNGIIRPPLAAI